MGADAPASVGHDDNVVGEGDGRTALLRQAPRLLRGREAGFKTAQD